MAAVGSAGDAIKVGDPAPIAELMKMEVCLAAPISGVVTHVGAMPGQVVRAGERVAVIEMRSAA